MQKLGGGWAWASKRTGKWPFSTPRVPPQFSLPKSLPFTYFPRVFPLSLILLVERERQKLASNQGKFARNNGPETQAFEGHCSQIPTVFWNKRTPPKNTVGVFLPGILTCRTDRGASMQGTNWHEEGGGRTPTGPSATVTFMNSNIITDR